MAIVSGFINFFVHQIDLKQNIFPEHRNRYTMSEFPQTVTASSDKYMEKPRPNVLFRDL